MKILTNYDFNKNQIMNVVIQKLAIAPTNPVSGQIYYDTSDNRAYAYNGTEWVAMDALGASMTGTDIVTAINGSTSIIDDDNLSTNVNGAITDSHTHTNKTILDGTQESFTTILKNKLDGIETGAEVNTVDSVDGKTGTVDLSNDYEPKDSTILKDADIGVTVQGYNSNTVTDSDYIHTDNNYTTTEKNKLDGIETGAEVNTVDSVDGKTGTVDLSNDYEPKDSTILKDADIGVTVQGYNSNTVTDSDYIHTDNNYTTTEKNKLAGIDESANNYTLPVAGTTLGGIKSGTGITIDELGNVTVNDDSHNHIISDVDGLQDALDALPTATEAQGYATTAEGNANSYTDTAIAGLVDSAPGTLDTLNELAQALGDDPNFATTVTNNLAQKTDKFSATVGDGVATSYVLTHNLNSRDVVVMLRETASPYAQVITDVEMTTVNTLTVKFATAPTTDQYTVVVIG